MLSDRFLVIELCPIKKPASENFSGLGLTGSAYPLAKFA